jgi:hypothetical protein
MNGSKNSVDELRSDSVDDDHFGGSPPGFTLGHLAMKVGFQFFIGLNG